MELQGYAPKDNKIINDNEGKTPYELLELGLSNKAFERLTAEQDAKKQAPAASDNSAAALNEARGVQQPASVTAEAPGPIQPAKVEQVPAKQPAVNKPQLAGQPRFGQSTGLSSIMEQLTIVGPTGIPQKMNAKQARKLAERNPRQYQILD